MKKLLFIILLLLYPILSYSYDSKWDKLDTSIQIVTSTVMAIDWMQTYSAAVNPNQIKGKTLYEDGLARNFIGKHPSGGSVNTYFTICMIGHPVISYLLPKYVNVYGMKIPVRNLWQGVWFGVESYTVYRNYQVGVRLRF